MPSSCPLSRADLNGHNWHVKCTNWVGEYRAVATCTDGRIAYGIGKTSAQSQYIGSVADCGRAKVVEIGSGFDSR